MLLLQVSSNSLEPKEIHLEDASNSMAELSSSDKNDPTKTLDNVLCVKQKRNTSLVSYEASKRIVGGTDIKVGHTSTIPAICLLTLYAI